MPKQDLKHEKTLFLATKENIQNFAELYKFYVNDIYRFNYSLLNNKHDAEDITSQTFIKFYQNINNFEWKNETLKKWLFTVSRNLCYSKYRKFEGVQLDESLEIKDEVEVSFVDEIMNKDLVERIKEEILKLSSIDQEIINLRIWEGMQFDEIAEIQNAKLSTVKLRFYRAIEKLKKQIESKNYMRGISFPILFTGIKDVATLPAYNASSGFLASSLHTILNQTTMTPTILTTIQTFLATKAGAVIATGLTALTLIGGGSGIYLFNQSDSNKVNNEESSLIEISTSKSLEEIIITQSPTLTPTLVTNIDNYENWTTFSSVLDGTEYSIKLPSNWEQKQAREGCGGPVFAPKDGTSPLYFTLCPLEIRENFKNDVNKNFTFLSSSPNYSVVSGLTPGIGNNWGYSFILRNMPTEELKIVEGYYYTSPQGNKIIYIFTYVQEGENVNLDEIQNTFKLITESLEYK